MDCRGFDSLDAMHEYMINQWNSRVRPNDEVVILGDLSIGDGVQTNEILKRLKGTLFLIEGNHDRFIKDKNFDSGRFQWIRPYEEVNDNKRKVVLSHYPVFCYNGQYRMDEQNLPKTYMLYGHVHNTYDELLVNQFQEMTRKARREVYGYEKPQPIPCHMINCFCMFSDYVPLTLDEWIENDKKRREGLTFPLQLD